MSNKNESSFYDVILDSINALNDRVGAHSSEQRSNFYNVGVKVDHLRDQQIKDKEELLEKITDLKVLFLKEHSALKTKVAVASAAISMIISMGFLFLKNKLGLD